MLLYLSPKYLLLQLLFNSLSGIVSSDEYFVYSNGWCTINSRDLSNMEYIVQRSFNMKLQMEYNSTKEKWTGYTPRAIESARIWSTPKEVVFKHYDAVTLCSINVETYYTIEEAIIAEPRVKLSLVKPLSSRHPTMLVCSAYDFYPRDIIVTWRKDGQDMSSAVISTAEMANGDWTYQIHSYLEYTPTPGERITCMVEHRSLSSPKMYDWDPSLPESERNQITVGASGLLLGMVCLAAGLIKYRKRCIARRVLVPTT